MQLEKQLHCTHSLSIWLQTLSIAAVAVEVDAAEAVAEAAAAFVAVAEATAAAAAAAVAAAVAAARITCASIRFAGTDRPTDTTFSDKKIGIFVIDLSTVVTRPDIPKAPAVVSSLSNDSLYPNSKSFGLSFLNCGRYSIALSCALH